MQQSFSSDSHMVVIRRGEELITQLIDYANVHGHNSAWMSGLGGASKVTLGFYDIDTKSYEWKEYDAPLEILNLTGNLSWVDGEPFWHIHGTFSGRDFAAVGGHVKELVVGLTCEVLVTPLEAPMTRVFDDETGLKLLQSP